MIYLDASALVTLTLERAHVRALEAFVDANGGRRLVTSTVGIVETVRACDLFGDFPDVLERMSAECDEVPITREVRDRAARLPARLRTLDAIHVASAESLGPDLVALVTYDRRMADAALSVGLPVAMPGVT